MFIHDRSIMYGFLTLIFCLHSFSVRATDSQECLLEKVSFLKSIINHEVRENISFGLTPDTTHDVIKAMPGKQIGEWFELRFAHSFLQQIRSVNPQKTIVYSWDNTCSRHEDIVVRDYIESDNEFSDEDIKQLLSSERNGILYTISPNHPLSEVALPGLMDNARKYNLEVTLLTDPTINDADLARLRSKYPQIKKMESMELIYRGMFNHFPSTLLYKNGVLIARPLLGARGREEIDVAFNSLLNQSLAPTPFSELSSIKESPSFGTLYNKDAGYKVIRKFHLPPHMDVKFIRSIPNSDNILIFTARKEKAVHLYDTNSEKIIRTWNHMNSPYVSGDGRFFVMMNDDEHLVFQEFDRDQPFFIDTMSAWYPGISVINFAHNKGYYRIITRMMAMNVQDYEIDFSTQSPTIKHVGEEHRVCTNLAANATPYISRFSGNKFTLIEPDNCRRIVHLLPDDRCENIENLGFWTWKAVFNFDDTKIGFTAVQVNSLLSGPINNFNQLFVGHSFIYDLPQRQLIELPTGIIGSFSFPEFMSDGSIIVLEKDGSKENMGYIYKEASF